MRRRRQPEFTVEYRPLPPKKARPSLRKTGSREEPVSLERADDVRSSDIIKPRPNGNVRASDISKEDTAIAASSPKRPKPGSEEAPRFRPHRSTSRPPSLSSRALRAR
jgi:hypothetical protein